MTGYARARRHFAGGELIVSLRSVNHRGLDIHFHQNSEFAAFENGIRAILKQKLARGHVEVRIHLTREAKAASAQYDHELLANYVAAFREASAAFGIPGDPDMNVALRLPGVFLADGEIADVEEDLGPELLAAVELCVTDLNAFREREGGELRELLLQEAAAIANQATRMKEIRAGAVPYFQSRLEERLRELLAGVSLDPRRLAEEAAILTDRSDVQEELSRLEIHTAQLREILETGGEVGKRLDFLLQEMNRETNTILSKTSGIGEAGLTMTNLALATKANFEKIREQALNLE